MNMGLLMFWFFFFSSHFFNCCFFFGNLRLFRDVLVKCRNEHSQAGEVALNLHQCSEVAKCNEINVA